MFTSLSSRHLYGFNNFNTFVCSAQSEESIARNGDVDAVCVCALIFIQNGADDATDDCAQHKTLMYVES